MLIRLAAVEDIAGVASLAERYWAFESIGGFDRARIETLLRDVDRPLVPVLLELKTL